MRRSGSWFSDGQSRKYRKNVREPMPRSAAYLSLKSPSWFKYSRYIRFISLALNAGQGRSTEVLGFLNSTSPVLRKEYANGTLCDNMLSATLTDSLYVGRKRLSTKISIRTQLVYHTIRGKFITFPDITWLSSSPTCSIRSYHERKENHLTVLIVRSSVIYLSDYFSEAM